MLVFINISIKNKKSKLYCSDCVVLNDFIYQIGESRTLSTKVITLFIKLINQQSSTINNTFLSAEPLATIQTNRRHGPWQ
jgi:hypothetical protein